MKYDIEKDAIGLYKYVVEDNIYYIGKSETGTILDRLKSHEKEEKFQDILDKAVIYVHPMKNKVEICAMEKLLINKYKPELNVKDANENGCECEFEEPEWNLCYNPDVLTIPEYIQYRKTVFNDVFEYINKYINNLSAYKELLDTYKRFKDDNNKISFTYVDNYDIREIISLSCVNEISVAFPIIDKIQISGSNQINYPHSVIIYLSESFCNYIKNKDIDGLISCVDDRIKMFSCLEYMSGNINTMLEKITQSIESTGKWSDLEDAGWAFLRMMNLEKQIYINQESEDYYKKIRVNKDGKCINTLSKTSNVFL